MKWHESDNAETFSSAASTGSIIDAFLSAKGFSYTNPLDGDIASRLDSDEAISPHTCRQLTSLLLITTAAGGVTNMESLLPRHQSQRSQCRVPATNRLAERLNWIPTESHSIVQPWDPQASSVYGLNDGDIMAPIVRPSRYLPTLAQQHISNLQQHATDMHALCRDMEYYSHRQLGTRASQDSTIQDKTPGRGARRLRRLSLKRCICTDTPQMVQILQLAFRKRKQHFAFAVA